MIYLEILKKINNLCRNNNNKFIYGLVTGLCSFIFSDFGKEYYVYNNIKNDLFFVKVLLMKEILW